MSNNPIRKTIVPKNTNAHIPSRPSGKINPEHLNRGLKPTIPNPKPTTKPGPGPKTK